MEFNFIINNYDKSFLNNADLRIYFSDFWLIYFLLQVLLINWQIILLYPLDTILYRRYKNLDRELQFWQTRYTLCIQSKRESASSLNARGGKRGRGGGAETSACAPNDFPSNRGDILRGVGWHLQWNPDRTRSPTICLNDISGIYGSAVPRTCFRARVPALALYANPRIQHRPPPIQRRPRIGACSPASRLARFNRPCRVFNGYISRHFEMPDSGAQDILLADILSR